MKPAIAAVIVLGVIFPPIGYAAGMVGLFVLAALGLEKLLK